MSFAVSHSCKPLPIPNDNHSHCEQYPPSPLKKRPSPPIYDLSSDFTNFQLLSNTFVSVIVSVTPENFLQLVKLNPIIPTSHLTPARAHYIVSLTTQPAESGLGGKVEFVSKGMNELIAESRELAEVEEAKTSQRPQLMRLSVSHEAIINWLLLNPGKNQMKYCAEHFGYTRAWLSSIVHSDAFQAKLRDRQEQLFGDMMPSLAEQATGVAQVALEQLGEKLEKEEMPAKFLLDTTDRLLGRLGYSPSSPAPGTVINNNTQVNNFPVSPDMLKNAREMSRTGDSNDRPALPDASGVPASAESNVGALIDGSSSVCHESAEAPEAGSESSGTEVRRESEGTSD